MSGVERTDPLPKCRFLVEIDTMLVGGFSEVRGLSMSIHTHEGERSVDRPFWQRWFGFGQDTERDATERENTARRLETSSPTLELRRGVTEAPELWTWFEQWLKGAGETRNVRVFLLNDQGVESRAWECRNAKPVGWDGPTLVAGESGVALETFELAHDGIWQLDV